ncbi:hypothetical protein [Pelosinus baikalensis]|uniref:Uncharacterized protein n=1 Tax=Pelosinus baikalensis TaxID=2892015 RepID=A0ABS8HRJ3_9FIRM|nr:hypothetical protein [Pelosinus baikalensis]MCC5465800.1 hypothetical protein [Pelosinus baikalensis]
MHYLQTMWHNLPIIPATGALLAVLAGWSDGLAHHQGVSSNIVPLN